MSASPILRVLNLGRKSYNDALKIQTKYHERIFNNLKVQQSSSKETNYLLLVEHDPVYTTGIRTGHYPESEEQRLRSYGADFVRTNRGGLITFHGPGQLIVYPIINLRSFPHLQDSVRCYVRALESTIINMVSGILNESTLTTNKKKLKERKIGILEGYPGVWVDGDRKIAAIGIQVADRITMHGVAINCNTDLTWFDKIVPCGIPGKGVTSLTKELSSDFTIGQAIPYFLESFRETFKCNLVQEDEGTD